MNGIEKLAYSNLLSISEALAASLDEAVCLTDSAKSYNLRWQEEIAVARAVINEARRKA